MPLGTRSRRTPRDARVAYVGTLTTGPPHYPDGPTSLMVVLAVYTVASRLTWHRSVAVGVVLLAVWVGLERVVAAHEGVATPGAA
ncbi:hypothetical protein Acsp06_01330 [Actinomycetospora sp. NBRC 106375]|uniref:hypothetical protein n=1 Tax=Actinomycetospora sp. NBRC 106375 TaxID=3032207 RepID=UPI0024A303AF|nr:hypothetical protein [Actinomycetospora sp. NBRC 106375]GLZ43948.1 hypothetical protein Acsp06_01330 [Actinomycetospora sp. NBRC 106375]